MTKDTTPLPPIRKRREAAGITMTALANASGVELSHLSHIETGNVGRPSWQTIQAILEALDRLEAEATP